MKYILFILAIWSLTSCDDSPSTAEEPKSQSSDNTVVLSADQLNMVEIATTQPTAQYLSGTVRVSGKMDVPPQNVVSISVPLGGYLKATRLVPGMKVSKGEVIAEVEDQQYIQLQQDYLTTRVQLGLAEKNFLRQRDLNESKASSDKVFQQATSEYESLKIQLSALSEKLKLIHVNPESLSDRTISKSVKLYAPFSGYVSSVNGQIGAYIGPSEVLFELINPADGVLKLKVFEKDLIQLNVGQKVIAYTNSEPDKKYECEVYLVSRDIAEDRTAEVHCRFIEAQPNLLPGMYLNAEIDLNSRTVIAVPDQATVSYEGRSYLFVQKGPAVFEMIEVSLGQQEEGWVELINAEAFSGRDVVVEGSYTLLMTLKNKAEE